VTAKGLRLTALRHQITEAMNELETFYVQNPFPEHNHEKAERWWWPRVDRLRGKLDTLMRDWQKEAVSPPAPPAGSDGG
jgi:hypothetical protein